MRILGIETSCDETAAAVVEASGGLKRPRFRILSNIVSSQVKLHAPYGGIVPALAAREHEKNLPIVLRRALGASLRAQKNHSNILKNIRMAKIDLVAVTRGPGLEPCLWRGINFAKGLAQEIGLPIIGVNHLEGHIYSNWLEPVRVITNYPARLASQGEAGGQLPITQRFTNRNIAFPAVCLIVSGGHTELVMMKNHGKYKLLGATRDDAAGEAFDKVSRLLGLGFPGGPAIDAIASKLPITNYQLPITLPRPMIHSKDYDFSFAGLKTAVFYLLRDLKAKKKYVPIREVAAEFQAAVVEVLAEKTLRASRAYGAKMIMISGGVSANSALRDAFKKTGALFPPLALTGDNAAMIAVAGYFNHMLGKKDDLKNLEADANLRIA